MAGISAAERVVHTAWRVSTALQTTKIVAFYAFNQTLACVSY